MTVGDGEKWVVAMGGRRSWLKIMSSGGFDISGVESSGSAITCLVSILKP